MNVTYSYYNNNDTNDLVGIGLHEYADKNLNIKAYVIHMPNVVRGYNPWFKINNIQSLDNGNYLVSTLMHGDIELDKDQRVFVDYSSYQHAEFGDRVGCY